MIQADQMIKFHNDTGWPSDQISQPKQSSVTKNTSTNKIDSPEWAYNYLTL